MFKDFNFKQAFDESYSITVEVGPLTPPRERVRLGYTRTSIMPVARNRSLGIQAALGWTPPGQAIVIGGAGFSFLPEAFEEIGYTRIIGIDSSTYIQNEKGNTDEADLDSAIVNIGLDPLVGEGLIAKNKIHTGEIRTQAIHGANAHNIGNGQGQNEVRQALGLQGNEVPDIILTESLLENFTDLEIPDLLNPIRTWVPTFIHFVVTAQPTGQTANEFNWKTLAEWKNLLPMDTFIEAGSYVVL